MSKHVAALVYRKKIGSMVKKAVMVYCAERANDDGSGIWASKTRIAKELECSKKTVIEAMRDLVADGLLIEAGQRKVTNGFVVIYDICIPKVKSLESVITEDEATGPITKEVTGSNLNGFKSEPVNLRYPTGEPPLPDGSPSYTRTFLEPSLNQEEETQLSLLPCENDQIEEKGPDEIEQGFSAFWGGWRSHTRKAQRAECAKVYRQACEGKRKGVDKVSPEDLNRASLAMQSQTEDKFLKAPLAWLNAGLWVGYLGQGVRQKQEPYRGEVVR